MEIKPIKTENDYNQALQRLEIIFDAKVGSPEGDELEVLGILIDKYENEKFPISLPDPIEAIKFRMEQMGYNQNDLANIVGLKSRASAIPSAALFPLPHTIKTDLFSSKISSIYLHILEAACSIKISSVKKYFS